MRKVIESINTDPWAAFIALIGFTLAFHFCFVWYKNLSKKTGKGWIMLG
jgi:hypothetical protein